MFKKQMQNSSPKGITLRASLRRGGHLALSTAIVVAIVVFLNLIVGQLPSGVREFDITDNSIYTISKTSKDFLESLDQDVEIVVLAQEGAADPRITKFVDHYASLSPRISVVNTDPVVNPSALAKYQADAGSLVVIAKSTGKQTTIPFTDLIQFDEYAYYYYGQYMETSFDAEGLLTSAVDYVTGDTDKTVYTLSGHGEGSLPSAVTSAIGKANLKLQSVNLLLDGGIPEDCDLLLSISPTGDLAADEKAMLADYLHGGGQVMVLLPEDQVSLPNWEGLLGEYGLALARGYIADTERYYQQFGSMYAIFPVLDTASTITSSFTSDDLALLINAHGMTASEPARDSIAQEVFLTTSTNGVAVDGDSQVPGTYVLGAASYEETEGGTSRLTCISAATLIDEYVLTSFPSVINLNIFMNALTAGFEDISNISIPAKSLEVSYNVIEGAGTLGLLFVVVIPAAVLIFGFIYWIRRRKM